MEVIRKTPQEIFLSEQHHNFQVVAQEDRLPICADSGELIVLSSVITEDGSSMDPNVYFVNRGDAYSVTATTCIPQELTTAYENPFATLCDILAEQTEPLFRDNGLLVLPGETNVALALTLIPAEGDEQPMIGVSPRAIGTERADLERLAFFPFAENDYAANLVKSVGRTIGHVVNLLQEMDGQEYTGRLTIHLPVTPDYYNFPSFDHFAGLEAEITQLREIIDDMRDPELLKEYGLTRTRGILLQGPGGVGKTELTKAFVRELGASYNFVSTSDIADMYVGKPIEHLRAVFDESKEIDGPYVIFFDEFDGLFSTGAGGNSGVTQALVAELKLIMSNLLDEYPNVIVVAATNSLNNFDPQLIRAGRFDTVLKIQKPQESALTGLFKKMLYQHVAHFDVYTLDTPEDSINTAELAAAATDLHPADIEAIINRLLLKRLRTEQKTGQRPPRISQPEILGAIALHRQSRPSEI